MQEVRFLSKWDKKYIGNQVLFKKIDTQIVVATTTELWNYCQIFACVKLLSL